MRNPVTVASGTFGNGRQYAEFFPLRRLGALTTKGVSLEPWVGNDNPRIAETASGMLNSIGLQNPGVEAFCSEELPWLGAQDVPVIVNVSGHSKEEYRRVIERLETEPTVAAYELNISCPNIDCGGMALGTDAALAAAVTRICREATARPLLVKLTPNVASVTDIAQAVEAAGADALSMINTILGMAIDVRRRKPVLARSVGGLSGPAIKPVALRMVYQTYQAVSIPILGMGGIWNASDALEFLLAGATAVAIGTANFTNPLAAVEAIEGIEDYCAQQGIARASDLTGALE
jgi:dihydroorotate dehydrogenase (NAD+) catalytic subunit